MDKENKPVWEEFPLSKYNCSLARYAFCLVTDPEFYKRYPTKEERSAKVEEAVDWMYQFPEVSML